MNPLLMMQLMSQMQQGGTQPAQGMSLPSVIPQDQQQAQPSFEQIMNSQSDVDPVSQLMMMKPQSSSILDEGALSAIKSAKTALQLDEEEKNRALGMGIVKLFSGMAKPGYGDGLNGALSALSQNMSPAIDAYAQEEGRVQNMNAALLNHISQMQAKQQEAWINALDKSEARKDRRDTLQMKRDHYDHMEKKQGDLYDLKKFGLGLKMNQYTREEDKQRHIDESLARGETPLEVLEPSARADYQKNALKSIREIPVNTRALRTIAKMRDIFKKHEDIGTYKEQWLGGSGDHKKEAGFWTIFGRNIADKKKLAAIQQLKKHASDLNLATILGTPGKVGTDLLKRTIAESSPGGTLTKEAFDAIAKDWEDRAHKNIRMAKKYQHGLRHKIVVSQEDEEATEPSLSNPAEMSDEELMRAYHGGQ